MKNNIIEIVAIIAIIAITAFVCYIIIGRNHRRPIEPMKLMVMYPTMIRKAIKRFTNLFTARRAKNRLVTAIINKAKYSERVYTLSDLEFIDRYGQELHDELLAHDEQKEQLLMLEI